MRFLVAIVVSAFVVACGGAEETAASDGAPAVGLAPLTGENVWSVDKTESSVTFRAVQEGASFEGRFDRFDVAVRLNPDDLSDAEIRAVIDMTSVDAGDTERNKALPTNDWFGTKSFPTATFVSTDITSAGEGAYEAAGALEIKGASKAIVLPFTLDIEGDAARASGTVTLNRSDYDIGRGEFADDKWVAYGVDVTVNIVASRQ